MDISVYLDPGSMVLIPVLNLIGYWIKNTGKVKSNFIPLILGAAGIILCAVRSAGEQEPKNVYEYVFSAFTQGILVASAAVYSNQIYKQTKSGGQNNDQNRSKS